MLGRSAPRSRWPQASLLGRLPPSMRDALLAVGTTRRYAPGEALARMGGTERDAFILLSGCAKIVTYSADGRQPMLAVRMGGDLVGEITALYGGVRSATVEIVTAADVVAIDHFRFHAFMEKNQQVADAVHQGVADKLRQATWIRTDISGARVPARLAAVLHLLVDTYGRPAQSGHVVDAPLTQADLGAIIGASKASVERAAAELRSLRLVQWAPRSFTVTNLTGLREFISGPNPFHPPPGSHVRPDGRSARHRPEDAAT